MLALLEAVDESPNLGEMTCLEDWVREGRPLRRVVAEYLELARADGPEVEAGFCAALGDYVGMCAQGGNCGSERYEAFASRTCTGKS
jgi:hypothetical protein